jgi:peptidoglycan/LPS O-acetylase OafA/YrhL
MCYSIYLYHFFITEQWINRFTTHFPAQHALWLDLLFQMAAVLPLILFIAAILYLTVERPCVLLSHAVTRRWKPSVRTLAPEVAT